MRFSSEVLPRHPLTCAHPVMPALTLCRSMYCGIRCLNCSTKKGRSGRGPTIDMSPFSTFQNCGTSSRSSFRSHCPIGVVRGSSSRAQTGPVVVFRVGIHRPELVDGEGLAVEAHPLLPVEDRTRRRSSDEKRDDERRHGQDDDGRCREHDVEAALDPGVDALERHVVHVDDRQAVEIFEPRAQGDELQDVGDDLDVDALAIRDLHEVEELGVLFERQRDVQVIDALAMRDLGHLRERAQQRQAAIPDVIAVGSIVHEADDLISELAVLQHAIGDHAAEVAHAGDQNAFQPDAGSPAPLEQFAHEFAQRVREHDGQDEEERPDDLRHLVRPARPRLGGGPVRLHVQRRDDSEDDSQNAADEHGEEVVHARAPAPQAVDALNPERQRGQDGDERQQVEVLLERRVTAEHRNQAALESDAVRQDERPHREHGVADDVERDEQAVVAPYHRVPAGAASVSSITARIRSMWRSRANCSA